MGHRKFPLNARQNQEEDFVRCSAQNEGYLNVVQMKLDNPKKVKFDS